jgi:hypothetical protein
MHHQPQAESEESERQARQISFRISGVWINYLVKQPRGMNPSPRSLLSLKSLLSPRTLLIPAGFQGVC